MAKLKKITKNKIDSEIDLSSDLDFEDFDYDIEPPKDDRKPITKFATGALEGFKDSLLSRQNLEKQAREALPREYGESIDFSSDVLRKAKDLYEETAREVRPAMKDAKRITAKLIPPDSKYIPKSIQETLNKWREEFKEGASTSQDIQANRESVISATIADAFKTQFTSQFENKKEQDSKDSLKMGLDVTRHKDIYGALNESNRHLSVLSNYETRVTLAYQKKSLELQFRHLFVSQDILNETKQLLKLQGDSLPNIVKNTGLPDFVKLQNHEHRLQIQRNKFYESINKGMFGGVNEYIEQLVSNVRSKIQDKVVGTANDIRSVLSEAESGVESTQGMGVDGTNLAGNVAGNLAGDFANNTFVKSLVRKFKVKFIDPNKKISAGAEKLKYGINNADRYLNEFKQSDKYAETFDDSESLKSRGFKAIMRTIQDVLPGTNKSATMDIDKPGDMLKPAEYTKRTDKSINEIIPGYLARILREIRIFRTKEDSELVEYNYSTNSFSDKKDILSSIKSSIFSQNKKALSSKELDKILDSLDSNSSRIPTVIREKIKKVILDRKENITGEEIDNLISSFGTVDYTKLDIGDMLTRPAATTIDSTVVDKLKKNLRSSTGNASGISEQLDSIVKELNADNLTDEQKLELKNAIMKNSTSKKLATTENISKHFTAENSQVLEDLLRKYLDDAQDPDNLKKKNKFSQMHNSISESIKDPNYKIQELIKLGKSKELMELGLIDAKGNTIVDEYLRQHYDDTPTKPKNAIGNIPQGPQPYGLFNNDSIDEIFGLNDPIPTSQSKSSTDSWAEKQEFFEKKIAEITDRLDSIIQNTTNTVAVEQSILDSIQKGFISNIASNSQGTSEPNFGKGIPGFIGKMSYKFLNVMSKITGGVFGATKKLAGISKDMTFGTLSAAKDFVLRVRDVYVEGENEPRMTAEQIKAGRFFDFATKKVLTTHRDIAGPVVDSTGQLIIAADELDKLYVRNLRRLVKLTIKGSVSALFSIGKGIAKFTTKFALPIMKAEFKLLGFLGKNALKSVKEIWGLLDKPQDIYVPGFADPVLLKIVMVNGGYRSKMTKKIITRPGEIDGPVEDLDGQVVLSIDQLRKGLFDVQGNPIKTPMQKILGVLGKAASAIGAVQKAAWQATKKVGRGMYKFAKGVGNALLGNFSLEINGKKSLSVLEQIRDFMFATFGKKKNAADRDGDGDRDGSAADIMQQRERERSQEPKSKFALLKEKAQGLFPTNLFGNFFKKSQATSEESLDVLEDIRTILGAQAAGSALGGGDLPDGKKKGKWARAKGAMSKAGGLAKGALKFGAKALPWAGAAAGAYGAYSNIKEGNYGAAAVDGALGVGSLALTGGSIAAGVGSTMGAIGTGLAAIISAPVALGVLAAAAVGAAGYYGYKYYKNNSLSPLDKLRYVQYGFDSSNSDYASKMHQLEDLLTPNLVNNGGTIIIDGSKLDVNAMLAIFDLDGKNENDLEFFFDWFQNKFKPVFLTHVSVLFSINQSKDIRDVNSLKDNNLKKYLTSVRMSDGPYDFNKMPIRSKSPYKVSGSKEVTDAYSKAYTDLKIDDIKEKSGTEEKSKSVLAPTAPPKSAAQEAIDLERTLTQTPEEAKADKNNTTTSTLTKEMVQGMDKATALLAVKYRAYGLKELEPSKVRAIRLLESSVRENLSYNNGGTASWSGDEVKILEGIAGNFGVADIYSKPAQSWLIWFKKRFLPVYLGYASGYMMISGKPDRAGINVVLKPIEQLNLAKIIAGLSGIWSISDSPWPNYPLNTDSKSVNDNIAFLEDVAKESKLQEETKAAKQEDPMNKDVGLPKKNEVKDAVAMQTNYTAPTGAEIEKRPNVSGASSGNDPTSIPKMAPGELSSGANGFSAINLQKGVTLNRVNPAFLKLFFGMVEEYNALTGKKVTVTDAFRTYQDQVEAKRKYGSKAADPGSSMHEFGLAIDADSKSGALAEMERMGLFKKYGLTRPIGGEPWHIEPAGVQLERNKFKGRSRDAEAAIAAAVGGGGGGMGTIANAQEGTFNYQYQEKLLKAAVKPTPKNQEERVLEYKRKQAPTIDKPVTTPAVFNQNNAYGADAEIKPKDSASVFKPTGTPPNIGKDQLDKSDYSSKDMKTLVADSAKTVGLDPAIALATVGAESNFNAGIKASTSSATGLYQFTNATWSGMMSKYSSKYGLDPAAPRTDPRANSLMGAQYLKDNMNALAKKTGLKIGPTEAYIGNFLGAGGATTFLNALHSDPNILGKDILPDAASANKSIFYSNGRARTVKEIYDLLNDKLLSNAKRLGVELPVASEPDAPNTKVLAKSDSEAMNKILGVQPMTQTKDTAVDTKSTAAKIASSIGNTSRDALNDNIGINPEIAFRKENAIQNPIVDRSLKPTEDLLTQSLDVEKKMLEMLTNIFNVVKQKSAETSNKEPQRENDTTKPQAPKMPGLSTQPYTAPKVPVTMNKTII